MVPPAPARPARRQRHSCPERLKRSGSIWFPRHPRAILHRRWDGCWPGRRQTGAPALRCPDPTHALEEADVTTAHVEAGDARGGRIPFRVAIVTLVVGLLVVTC